MEYFGKISSVVWAACQIRKITGCACTRNDANVFSPLRVSDPDMHHGTRVMHVPWCMLGSLASGFRWSRGRGRRSRHSWRMRNPQFYVSGKSPMALTVWSACPWFFVNEKGVQPGFQQHASCSCREILENPNDVLCFTAAYLFELTEAEWRIFASVNWATFGSNNGLSPVRRQAIVWTNTDILPIRPPGIIFDSSWPSDAIWWRQHIA